MRIAIVGGGPGGLFAATLIKRTDPAHEVLVFERNQASDTFGFGVVFSDATLAEIHAADPVVLAALTDNGVHWDNIEVRLHGERHVCGGNGMSAVERKTLLGLLQRQAVSTGVDVRFATDVDLADVLADGFDLIVAADGANSRIRERYADAFEPAVDTATAKFIWLGTTYPFAGLTFVHERGPHGVFAVHGYPIGNGISTFIVETSEEVWRAAGLDAFDVTVPPGPSDLVSRDYLQELFAKQIDGEPLLVNSSRWGNFRTHRARRWRHRVGSTAIALLGDAAHTAHFSVGSGTKMAMEDAIALAAALAAQPRDLDAALDAYEQCRRPQVEKIQNSARPSLSWWEHFGRAHDALPGWQFAYHFFTRSLTDRKLRKRDPVFVDAAHRSWQDTYDAAPLASALDVGGRRADGRSAHIGDGALELSGLRLPLTPTTGGEWALALDAPDQEAELAQSYARLRDGIEAGAAAVAVRGGTALTRRLLCEQARLGHGRTAVLVEDCDDDQALTAVLSGRADVVAVPASDRVGRRS